MPREFSDPSPKAMGVETTAGRPTESDFAEKIEGYLYPLRHGMRTQYESTKMELKDMAEGGGDPGVREQYYSGWTNEDFKEVLRRLEEAEKNI
jgi:hypothetical protein